MAAALFWCLVVLVVLTPLPLGSDQQWASSAMSLTVGLIMVAWSVLAWRDRDLVRLRRSRVSFQTFAFAIVLVWFFVQVSPMTPESWHHPMWHDVQVVLDSDSPGRVALAPEAAIRTIMRILAYAGVFWLALHYGRQEHFARSMLWAIAVAGLAYAVYGLVVHLGNYGTILWYEKWGFKDSLTSTFVNRSTYATYAGLGLVVSLALLTGHFLAITHQEASPLQKLKSRSLESWGLSPWFLAANVFIIGTALLLSNSRGGLAATLVGIAVLFVMVTLSGRLSRRAVIVMGAALLLFSTVLLSLSGSTVIDRLTEFAQASDPKVGDFGRLTVYGWTTEQIGEKPFLGNGLGSFSGTFSVERDARFGDNPKSYYRAHNTYLELMLDSGVPAALAIFAVIGSFAWVCLKNVRNSSLNPTYPILGVAATVIVGIHSLYDFSMEVPGVAVTYMAILGAVVGQSWPKPRAVGGSPNPTRRDRGHREQSQSDPAAADSAGV